MSAPADPDATAPSSPSPDLRALRDAFESLVELPAAEREPGLLDLAARDPALVLELRALLAEADRTGTALDARAMSFPDEVDAPPRVPGFELVRRIGRGGSATVYLADQHRADFERRVALKVFDRVIDGESLRRFREEQRILARLEHPGIARLYDAGTTELGQPYLALELVEGRTILDHCASRNLGLRERVELFLAVLDAVAFAHGAGVVHRDLKPANILVSDRGEVKLLDFGIAKLIAEPGTDEETRTLRRAMTPAYASPEQVGGGRVTEPSDVYSLGVVLYELLTHTLPYRLENRELSTIERAIRDQDPEPPSSAYARITATTSNTAVERVEAVRWRRSLRGDLDAVLLKALRKSPRARYATVRELAEDLRRSLAGLPVGARRGDVWQRSRHFLRRHRVAAGFAIVLGATGLAWSLAPALREAWRHGHLGPPAELAALYAARPTDRDARRLLVEGADLLGQYDVAAAADRFRRASDRVPNDPMAWDGLARAELALGELDRARDAARRADRLAEGLPAEERDRVHTRALLADGNWSLGIPALEGLFGRLPERVDIGLELVQALVAHGQTDEANSVIGRMRQIPGAGAPDGDPRIDLAESLVAFRLGEYQRAAAVAARAKPRFATPSAALFALRAERLHAQAINGLDRREEARKALAEISARAAAAGWRADEAAAQFALGRSHLRGGKREDGAAAVRRAGAGFAAVGDRAGWALAESEVAFYTGLTGDLEAGLQSVDRAVAAAREAGDRWVEGVALNGRTLLLNWKDDVGEVNASREPLLAALRESGNRPTLATALLNFAAVSADRLEFDRCEAYLDEVERIEPKVGNKNLSGKLHWVRAYFEQARGNLDLARHEYRLSLDKSRESGNQLEIGNVLQRIAWLELGAGSTDAAEASASEAVRVMRAAGNEGGAKEIEVVLAWVDARRGRAREAWQRLERLKKASLAGEGVTFYNLVVAEARMAEALGDWHRAAAAHRDAIARATRANQDYQRIDEQVGLARSLRGLGQHQAMQRLIAEVLPEAERRGLHGAERELRGLLTGA